METMKVKAWAEGQGDYVLINAEDFDAEKHAPYGIVAPKPPVAPSAVVTEIPADWQAKHWKQRVALAKQLGWVDGEPTTEQADGWISDILTHREPDVPLDDLGGLTLREIHADLTAAGVEWEADATPADLLALLAMAKGE